MRHLLLFILIVFIIVIGTRKESYTFQDGACQCCGCGWQSCKACAANYKECCGKTSSLESLNPIQAEYKGFKRYSFY